MALTRINQLPTENDPSTTDNIAIDGATTRKTTIQKAIDAAAPLASQAEAEAGVNSTKRMTPLLTAQAIAAQAVTRATFDPTGVDADAFNLSNHTGTLPSSSVVLGSLSDDVNQALNRPKHAGKLKLLLTSDWQPLAADEDATQIPLQTAMMQDIETYHSDVDYAFFNGDLIDKPTLGDGSPNLYTYGMLIDDIRTNIPSIPWPARWFPNAGNHDRDGTGAGSWAHAWSLYSYKSEVGPLWYYVDIGNFRFIMLGDMMGSNTGEILPEAMLWFRKVLAFSKSRNVVILMHQPPNPTIYPPSSDPNAASFQRSAAELVSIIGSYDNIAYVQYGHVGGTIGNATLITVAYGTTWVNCQMGIPSMVNSGISSNPLVYSLTDLVQDATTITIRRWNASAHDWLATTTPSLASRDVTITLKYPVSLAGDVPDFDGRKNFDPQIPYVMSKLVVSASIDDYRAVDGSTPADMYTLELRLNDDSNTNVGGNLNGIAVYVPGADNSLDADGYQINGVPAGLGGVIGYRRTESTDTNYESAFVVKATNLSGNLEELMTLYTTTDSRAAAYFPLTSVVSGVGFGIGDDGGFTTVIDTNRHIRLRTYTVSELSAITPSPVGMLVRCSNGNAGQPCLAVSTGSGGSWVRIPLGATVSAT